jgi:phosphate transport system substrate-binding protein
MKKILIALTICASACTPETEMPDNSILKIAGSESEKPLVLALADEYSKTHTTLQFNITGGGTNEGISALITGRATVASASRIISSEELNTAKVSGIEIHQAIIAQDVIAIITHPSAGVEYITVADLKSIYDGSVTNWKALGGNDQPIYPIGRSIGSGTRTYMLHRLALDAFSPKTIEFETYEDIVNNVAVMPGAIAYVSNRYIYSSDGVLNSSVWVMNVSLNGMPYTSPLNREDIQYGDYPLMRPLFQYYTNEISRDQLAFIEFELSEEGQQLAEKSGYVRLNETQMNINRKNATRTSSSDSANMLSSAAH